MDTRHGFIYYADNLDLRRLAGCIAVIAFTGRVVDVGLTACVILELYGQLDFVEFAGRALPSPIETPSSVPSVSGMLSPVIIAVL